ncbi:MAG: YjjG family noncanonical pyrimidine nucleotidase [Salibacteraceae bacterium]
MFKNITHVFFDLDHTLWDFETNSREALDEIFQIFELGQKRVRSAIDFIHVYERINENMWAGYRDGSISKNTLRKDRFPRALAAFNINDDKLAQEINDYYLSHSPLKSNLFDHAHTTLDYLKSKYKMYIITNGFEEVQNVKMKGSDLDRYFEKVITSEMVGVRKPDPKIFDFALSEANAKSEFSVMIGDDLIADVLGGQKAGMKGVFFNPTEKKHMEQIDKEIACLSELKTFL